MGLKFRKNKVSKGAPSGLVVSLLLHAGAFFIAGLFVVFTVVTKKDPEFVPPPPVERPKMQLKKPKVKVQKSSNPKPSSRIVAKVQTKEMPEIQLPDLMGAGEGLLGEGTGLGGEFLDLPEIKQISAFGNDISSGNDLVGTFYDFKRSSSGMSKPIFIDHYDRPYLMDKVMLDFLNSDWSEAVWSKYYKSPTKLYANCICIGCTDSVSAPEAFGEDTEGYAWAIVYRGKLVYPEDIKFRFRGAGVPIAVRVNGKVVLMCTFHSQDAEQFYYPVWQSSAGDTFMYPMGNNREEIGDWIELKGGEPVDIEVLISDLEGGVVTFMLNVEVEGQDYERNPYGGGPTCPIYKTDNLTRAQIDALYVDVFPGDANLTNGPVFCDYFPEPVNLDIHGQTNPPPLMVKDFARESRKWTNTDGQTLDGNLLINSLDYVLIDTSSGQKKIPKTMLSDEDKKFLTLSDPPEFKIEFLKGSRQIDMTRKANPTVGIIGALAVVEYTYGVSMKYSGTIDYEYPLTVEYFAIGEEINGDKYILLDRQSDTVIPGKTKRFEHQFEGPKVRLKKYGYRAGSPFHGRRNGGYLIVVRDEDGRIVQCETSNDFLFENLGKLESLPVNAFFDHNCERSYPTRPTSADRPSWVL
ncbi:MAG: hypothetical protein JXR25_10665 [Pontiellaceae bacterium]|nr:hypothetical protein [Pontiellaceae bacterium]MBN2785282.1 hypothetical protein [Pontiellaceae bacterium]